MGKDRRRGPIKPAANRGERLASLPPIPHLRLLLVGVKRPRSVLHASTLHLSKKTNVLRTPVESTRGFQPLVHFAASDTAGSLSALTAQWPNGGSTRLGMPARICGTLVAVLGETPPFAALTAVPRSLPRG